MRLFSAFGQMVSFPFASASVSRPFMTVSPLRFARPMGSAGKKEVCTSSCSQPFSSRSKLLPVAKAVYLSDQKMAFRLCCRLLLVPLDVTSQTEIASL